MFFGLTPICNSLAALVMAQVRLYRYLRLTALYILHIYVNIVGTAIIIFYRKCCHMQRISLLWVTIVVTHLWWVGCPPSRRVEFRASRPTHVGMAATHPTL